MADTELERQLRHSLDRFGRNPRDRADRAFYAHSVPPYWPSPRSNRGDHRDSRRGSGGWSGPPAAAWINDLQDSQVLLHLPVGQLDAVLVPLLPLQLDVAVEDVRAERLAHERRLRELVDRLAERLGEGDDAALTPLLGGEVVEVRLHRIGQLVALLDPLEPRVQERREREVRVARR